MIDPLHFSVVGKFTLTINLNLYLNLGMIPFWEEIILLGQGVQKAVGHRKIWVPVVSLNSHFEILVSKFPRFLFTNTLRKLGCHSHISELPSSNPTSFSPATLAGTLPHGLCTTSFIPRPTKQQHRRLSLFTA